MNSIYEDTIVGISTTLNNSAISIIRISGNDAKKIVNTVFLGKNLLKVKSHTIHYGHIIDYDTKEIIDEVLVSVFLSPKSYTTEDTVEINCHGGVFVTNQVLEQLLLRGARQAEPGEFTKRAFLNGRIDLTKAESVMDVIASDNKKSLTMANSGLRGDIKELIDDLKEQVLNIIATINVNIDYPEYDDVEQLTNEKMLPKLLEIKLTIEKTLEKSRNATILKNGIDTVIVGKPNVGKSSLLNLLLSENKAIVTNIPGTTRDIVEGRVNLSGLVLNLVDTAGIRDTTDMIEKIGVEKTLQKIEEAELILFVFDGNNTLDQEDKKLLEMLKQKNKKYLKIINKDDLEIKIDKDFIKDAVLINTLEKSSITKIENAINKFLNIEDVSKNLNGLITNARQIGKLNEALKDINDALNSIKNSVFIDFVEIPLKSAWRHLGEITGIVADEDILNELFSKFCLGK